MDSTSFHLILRLLLGCVFLISSVGKCLNLPRFEHALTDYDVLPGIFDTRFHLLRILSYGIPAAELVAGASLLTGIAVGFGAAVAVGLLLVFCCALVVNLRRGRFDMSCHCGGAMGDHPISWWMVCSAET
jgi:uncharacterized membrane protein YphA (DoxX/SURF4 family)